MGAGSKTITGEYLTATKAVLDLGNVLEMASITVNGHKMPVRWCAPYSFDITPYIHAGNNQLEVEDDIRKQEIS